MHRVGGEVTLPLLLVKSGYYIYPTKAPACFTRELFPRVRLVGGLEWNPPLLSPWKNRVQCLSSLGTLWYRRNAKVEMGLPLD